MKKEVNLKDMQLETLAKEYIRLQEYADRKVDEIKRLMGEIEGLKEALVITSALMDYIMLPDVPVTRTTNDKGQTLVRIPRKELGRRIGTVTSTAKVDKKDYVVTLTPVGKDKHKRREGFEGSL